MQADDSKDRERRANSVTEFAEELRRLRAAAGNPSFRKMAGMSQCISHTTLHEAASGSRFPSWETTREFVKACGGDEAGWRARWERASNTTRPEQPPAVAPEPPDQNSRPGRSGPRRRLSVVLGLLAFAGTSYFTFFWQRTNVPPRTVTPNPPNRPMVPGDANRFIADITIPDGASVEINETFLKIWEIENSGTATWHDRYLQREAAPVSFGECRTVHRIPIGDTLPNERVKISVTVTAPSAPGTCMVKWKMVDEQGRQFFPTYRPVFFLVHVRDDRGDPGAAAVTRRTLPR